MSTNKTIGEVSPQTLQTPSAETPWVTILVPVYEVEDYIERCARSIFEQTYPNIEYIFCDDASPDRSMEVLERVMNDYPERDVPHQDSSYRLYTVPACGGRSAVLRMDR